MRRSRTPPAGWSERGGTSSSASTARACIASRQRSRTASRLDITRDEEQLPIEERLDRRYEDQLYDAAVRRLDERDQRAVAAFELAGSMRAAEKEYGIPKSSVQRAFKRLQVVISSETGRQATRRARSRALAYHLGYMSPPQAAEMKARLEWDTGLLMAVRSLEVGARRAVALLPPGSVAADAGARSSGFLDRVAAVADRVREGAVSLASRGGGHEAETAGGLASGGASAGLAAKASSPLASAARRRREWGEPASPPASSIFRATPQSRSPRRRCRSQRRLSRQPLRRRRRTRRRAIRQRRLRRLRRRPFSV